MNLEAVVKIQALVRGYLCRKRIQQIQQDFEFLCQELKREDDELYIRLEIDRLKLENIWIHQQFQRI